MRLADALALRRELAARNPHLAYAVRRGRRSPGAAPFYVAVAGRLRPAPLAPGGRAA